MMNSIKNKIISLTKNILIGISLLIFIGCEDTKYNYPNFNIELSVDLPQDENGYYHMNLDMNKWQSVKRLTAHITSEGKDYEWWERDDMEWLGVKWRSTHYWTIGDTLGYIVKRGLTEDLMYVNYDTTYVTQFYGFEVPTVNGSSYPSTQPDTYGEVNTMFGPVKTMVGDTVHVNVSFTDWYGEYKDRTFGIILN